MRGGRAYAAHTPASSAAAAAAPVPARQHDASPDASGELASIMHGDYRTARIGVRRTIIDAHDGAPHASRASLCVAA
jgi:hypothetical protein